MQAFVRKRLFFQDFKIRVYEGLDGIGDKKFKDTPLEIKGYYNGNTTILTNSVGEQIVSSGHFFVSSEDLIQITEGSFTTIPESDGEYLIVHLKPYYKEFGTMSYGVVYLA